MEMHNLALANKLHDEIREYQIKLQYLKSDRLSLKLTADTHHPGNGTSKESMLIYEFVHDSATYNNVIYYLNELFQDKIDNLKEQFKEL